MKKYLTILFLTIAVSMGLCYSALAATEDLIPTVVYPGETNTQGSKITLVKQLPQAQWPVLLAGVIQLILAITGSLAFLSFTVGGVMMVTAHGNDEQIGKGKKILFWSIGALAIIVASYGIVLGITQLKFFQ